MITAIFQELDERSPDEGIVCSRNLTDAVIVPVRYVEQTVFAVGRLILLQRPVGDTVAGGIRPGDQAATRRGTDTAGIGLGEHDSLAGGVVGDRSGSLSSQAAKRAMDVNNPNKE